MLAALGLHVLYRVAFHFRSEFHEVLVALFKLYFFHLVVGKVVKYKRPNESALITQAVYVAEKWLFLLVLVWLPFVGV